MIFLETSKILRNPWKTVSKKKLRWIFKWLNLKRKEKIKGQKETVELNVQLVEHLVTCKTLACENDLLNKRVDKTSRKDSKGNSEGCRMQLQMKEELTNVKDGLISSHYKNIVFQNELICVKTKLEKALKWTISSQPLIVFISQESSSSKDLGYNSQEDRHNSSVMYEKRKDDVSCIHCVRNSHSKDICPFKTTTSEKGRKQRLPTWIRKILIFSLSPF